MTGERRTTLPTLSHSLTHPQVSFRRHSWWKPHTRLEKILLLLFLGFLLVSLVLAVTLLVIYIKYWTEYLKQTTCQSKGCILAAATITRNMNTSADPCIDFYNFACGNFEQRIILNEEQSSTNSFNSIDRDIQARMREFIQQPWKPSEPKYYRLIKDLYASCMNVDNIQHLGGQPLLNTMRAVGGWPVVEGDMWKADEFDWIKTSQKFRGSGIFMNVIIDLSVVQDLKNSSRYILQLDQPYLGMPDRSYLLNGLNDPLVQAYYEFMVKTAILLGASQDRAESELRNALEFEIKLAEISIPKEELRNYTKMYNKMTPPVLQKLASNINWIEYLNGFGLPTAIADNEEIIVVSPSFISNISLLLERTDKRVIANYMFWRMAKSLLDTLDRRFQVLRAEYTRHLTGQASEDARAYYCSDTVFENLEIAIGAMYVTSLFNPNSKALVSEIVNEVKAEFYNSFETVDWLDKQTLDKALKKMAAMRDYIAYPEELLNETKVDEFHKKLFISKDEYFHNILRMNKFSTDFYLSRLRQSADESQWISVGTAANVNAFYRFADNTMVFYAAILNGAFFNHDYPMYMNFGSIGFIVGHEISHGFDDMGRQYDEYGNLNNWWTKETDTKFLEKSRCIVEQYGNYTVPQINIKVNGINTQGENIADIGGMKKAYNAYSKWVSKNGEELPLPGLGLTSRQTLWLSNANVWCSKSRKEYLQLQVNTDFHSPAQFRIIGPFSNSPDFARDFNCPLNSPMNPEKKCEVW